MSVSFLHSVTTNWNNRQTRNFRRVLVLPIFPLLSGWLVLFPAEALPNDLSGHRVQNASRQIIRPIGIERAMTRYLLARWKHRVSRVEVRVLAPRRKIYLPAGSLSVHVKPLAKVIRPRPTRFRIIMYVDGVLVKDQPVSADIKAYAQLVLTTRQIQKGKLLGAQDLTIREWRIRAIEHGLADSLESTIGKKIKVTIPQGFPIPNVALQ